MSDHKETGSDLPDDDSGNEYFDIGGVEDTDQTGPEMAAAADEAKKVIVNLQHRATEADLDRAEVYAEASLVKRARMLTRLGPYAIKFVHFKKGNPNDPMDIGTRAKPDSLMNRHAVYDALFDNGSGKVPYPHYDTFKGRLVDHEGEVFGKNLRTRELVQALDAAGMENPKDKEVQDSLRSWALDHKRDSLACYFNQTIPQWDGTSRLESKLIELFQPHDTPLTRLVGKYFWLALYMRINFPGTFAPISLSLIGAQDAGKSWFSVLLCRLLTGDPSTGPVQLDLSAKNYNQFLRNITGKSLVANVGEMAGFKKGDMLRIKEFVSKGEDDLDFKFEDSQIKQRQWIIIMDGNEYSGLQRDDTGNRRFYPLFAFQSADVNGQPNWEKGRKIDYTNFKEDLWQIMAECRAWHAANGDKGWLELVNQANREVSEFSAGERDHARGIVSDDNIEINLKVVLLTCDWRRVGAHGKWPGFFVASTQVNERFLKLTRREPYSKGLTPHMSSMGFEGKQLGLRGYFIKDEHVKGVADGFETDEAALLRMIWRHGSEDTGLNDREVDAEIAAIKQAHSGDGGF